MVTSTPVRSDHSNVLNMGLGQSFNKEHNQSIGDIAEGNFVSFSSSDLYCISDGEQSDKASKPEEGQAGEQDDLMGSLCENCRSSLCSNVSSSTLTLTPETKSCSDPNLNQTEKTINVDDIISICESVATLETEDGYYDVAISDEIDIDTLEDKTNTNVSKSQDSSESSP